MDGGLDVSWDIARPVQCCYYQSKGVDFSKRLHVAAHGIELHHPSDEKALVASAASASTASAAAVAKPGSGQRNARDVDVIPWCEVLGAAVLTSDQLKHVPGYQPAARNPARNDEPSIEFVVFGCIPKARALKRKSVFTFGNKLDVLSCFGGSDSAKDAELDAAAPTKRTKTGSQQGLRERVLVQWVFRYEGEDADTVVPHIVDAIQRFADPRIAHSLKPPGDKDLSPLSRRKYLVLINPMSGPGKSQQIYESTVAPVFQQSNIECEVVITQRQHHATDIVANIPLNIYDCVVSVSGDGLLSEILQGIMKRPDWKQAIQQPLGIIPGGSGNGLSVSLLHRSGERTDPLNAAFALAKGSASELDLATVVNGKQDVMYSFLSVEWAFIADVDIESERYRMFGGLRFTISTIAKMLSKHKRYSGTLRYLSSESDADVPLKYHERLSDPLTSDEGDVTTRPALDCLSQQQEDSLQEQQWNEISGQFHMFWGMNVSHAASDAHVAPKAPIDDGYYYLMVAVEGSFSRVSLTKLLLGLDDGSHIGQKQVQLIRTRAFTLHVDNPSDLLCVDGELFEGPDLKVEVHRALGRVVCLPPQ